MEVFAAVTAVIAAGISVWVGIRSHRRKCEAEEFDRRIGRIGKND